MGCASSKDAAAGERVAEEDPGKAAQPAGSQAPALHGSSSVQELLHRKYDLGKTLGSGSFATARLATNKETGEKVAIKTLMRNHENFDKDLLEHEIAVMKKLTSPYCIRLIEVIEDSKAVHLVEELAVGGELFDRILDLGHFSEADAAKVIKQAMLGIAHMHSMGTCHRDLKPENLLMVSSDKSSPLYLDVKIADFGLSSMRPVQDVSMSTVCGTPDYLAPEIILIAAEGPLSRKKYDSKVDVWAMGVICYTMICGYPPFWSENMAEMLHAIKRGDYNFDGPSWENVSDETKSFVAYLLTRDPAKRPTSQQCLEHPFLTSTSLKQDNLKHTDTLRSYIDSRRTGKIFRVVRIITRMELAGKMGGERKMSTTVNGSSVVSGGEGSQESSKKSLQPDGGSSADVEGGTADANPTSASDANP